MSDKVKLLHCKNCNEYFESAWSQEEADAEAILRFGRDSSHPDMVCICDDCHKQMLEWEKTLTDEQKKSLGIPGVTSERRF